MTAPPDDQPGFAPDDDAPIPYMARTREYYQAIGYTTPYRWAHYVDAPFQPLRKPLAHSRVAVVTTAAPFDPAKGDQGPGANTMAAPNSIRSMTATFRRRMTCGFLISPMIACTPPPTTAAPGFRCRNCSGSQASGGSATSRRVFSAHRPIAAIASPSRPMRPIPRCRADIWMPRCWCRTARYATRPSAWSLAIWRPTAFPRW